MSDHGAHAQYIKGDTEARPQHEGLWLKSSKWYRVAPGELGLILRRKKKNYSSGFGVKKGRE